MKIKRKLLSIPIVIFFGMAIILPTSFSYESNAVETNQQSSVSCEKITYDSRLSIKTDYLATSKTLAVNEPKTTVTPTKPVEITKTVIENTNRWNIELTNEEIDLLAKILWLEARGETDNDDLGQKAVVECILNRMIHWDFEGTLYEVLSRKNAFSTWRYRNTAEPTEVQYEVIEEVLSGETDILDLDVVYFSTEPRNKYTARHIGNHFFNYYEYSSKEVKR